MPISLLILVVFEYVVRRKQRACSREKKIDWVGLNGVFCHKSSQNALPRLVILGLRQELFCDLELLLDPSALNNNSNKINQDRVRSIIMDNFNMNLTSLDHGCLLFLLSK